MLNVQATAPAVAVDTATLAAATWPQQPSAQQLQHALSGVSSAASPPPIVQPPEGERLSGFFTSPPAPVSARPQSTERSSGGGRGWIPFWPRSPRSGSGGGSSSSHKAAASKGGGGGGPTLGQPLDAYALDEAGVPKVLSTLRAQLLACDGHLVEGIFRVSPSQSSLKAAQKHAEHGLAQLPKIHEPECLAHLIKLWFREPTPRHQLAPPPFATCFATRCTAATTVSYTHLTLPTICSV